MAGAVHLETQHTAASAKDIEMWLCVSPRLLATADTAPSPVQAKCNTHVLLWRDIVFSLQTVVEATFSENGTSTRGAIIDILEKNRAIPGHPRLG